MGGWKLEVARMGIYMTFPVALFYVFNQPQWFEEYIVQKKKEMMTPMMKENSKIIEELIKKEQTKRNEEYLRILNESQTK